MIALYRHRESPIHRAPAWVKLLALVVLALAVSLYPHTVVSAGIAAGAVAVMYAISGFGPRVFLQQVWLAKWIVVLIVVTQLLFLTPTDAAINTVRVLAIVLMAALVTLTTRSEDLLTALEGALTPLGRVGVDARRVSLTLSLTISMIPVVADIVRRVREAQQARGVRLGFRIVVPVLVIALRHADDVADALTARGVD